VTKSAAVLKPKSRGEKSASCHSGRRAGDVQSGGPRPSLTPRAKGKTSGAQIGAGEQLSPIRTGHPKGRGVARPIVDRKWMGVGKSERQKTVCVGAQGPERPAQKDIKEKSGRLV